MESHEYFNTVHNNDKSSGGVGKQWMSRGFDWEEVAVVCGKMWW